MPLLDHFHPPLSRRRHWDSFHGAWAEAIARHFNEELLPEHFFAEARVNIGGRVEIDVGTFEDEEDSRPALAGNGGVAVWAPPRPSATAPLDFSFLDTVEVQVINDSEGPRVVAAVELVSPANKDRESHRQAFAVKCASYLQDGISVAIVDVVTERRHNLHAALLDLLKLRVTTPGQAASDLYATAYRTLSKRKKRQVEIWAERLVLGASLPTLPLWLGPDLSIPLDLESAYQAACAARRLSAES